MLLLLDLWSNVIQFCDTRTWIQLSYTCKQLNQFKHVRHVMTPKQRTVMSYTNNKTSNSSSSSSSTDISSHLSQCKESLFNIAFYNEDINSTIVSDEIFRILKSTIHTLLLFNCSNVTDEGFKYFENSTTLHYLNMSHMNQITNLSISYLQCSSIRELHVGFCTSITDEAFIYLKNCIHLNSLHIVHNDLITDQAFEYLRGGSVQLNHLTIKRCDQITDLSFQYLFERGTSSNDQSPIISNLISLKLGECNGITNKSFEYMQKNGTCFSNFEKLELEYCDHLTDEAFEFLKFSNTTISIKTLKIVFCRGLTSRVLDYLTAHTFNSMKLLHVALSSEFSLQYLRPRERYSIIHTLCLHAISNLTPQCFEMLNNVQIYELLIEQCNTVNDHCLKHVRNSGIRSFALIKCDQVTDQGLYYLTGGDEQHHSSTCSIYSATIEYCSNITDQGVMYLKNANLRSLRLFRNAQLTDESLQCLESIKEIQEISIGYLSRFTGTGFKYLNGSSIGSLKISFSDSLVDESFVFLKNCLAIDYLEIYACTHITDEAFDKYMTLEGTKSIRILRISFCSGVKRWDDKIQSRSA